MKIPISHSNWQTLRVLTRSKKPVLGHELRIVWNRATKDGTFLLKLVQIGLLEIVGTEQPKPFESKYRLTAAGSYAADYGEYECDRNRIANPLPSPPPKPPEVPPLSPVTVPGVEVKAEAAKATAKKGKGKK